MNNPSQSSPQICRCHKFSSLGDWDVLMAASTSICCALIQQPATEPRRLHFRPLVKYAGAWHSPYRYRWTLRSVLGGAELSAGDLSWRRYAAGDRFR